MSDVKYHLSDVRCQMSDAQTSYQAEGSRQVEQEYSKTAFTMEQLVEVFP